MSDCPSESTLYLPKHCLVPLEARLDPNLPDGAKIYLGELNVLANRYGYVFASDEALAQMKGVSTRCIERWHTSLEKGGHICRRTWKEHYTEQDKDGVRIRTKRRIYIGDSCPDSNKDAEPTPDSNKDTEPPKMSGHCEPPKMSGHCEPPKMSGINKQPLRDNRKESIDDAREAPMKIKKEILPAVDSHPVFCHLQGLVGRKDAELLWMNASRADYDIEPVVNHCMRSDKIRSPIRVIQDAISHRKDYSKRLQEPNTGPSRAKRRSDDSNHRPPPETPAEDELKANSVWPGDIVLDCYGWCADNGYENPYDSADGWVEVWIEKTGANRNECLAKAKERMKRHGK